MSWKKSKRIKARLAVVEEDNRKATLVTALKDMPDDALFYSDKKGDAVAALKATIGLNPKPPKPKHASKADAKLLKAKAKTQDTRRKQAEKRKATKDAGKELYDVWGDDAGGEGGAGAGAAAASKPKRRVRPPPSSIARVPVVPKPAPGTSYNPSYEEHQDAIGPLVVAAMERKEEALKRRRKDMPDPQYWKKLSDLKDKPDTAEELAAWEEHARVAPRPAKALTTVQKNRRARVKAEEEARKKEKEDRMFHDQIDKIKTIKKAIVDREKDLEERRTITKAIKKQEEEDALEQALAPTLDDVALSHDLDGTLRRAKGKAAGAVLKDRFSSVQLRQLAPTDRRFGKKRAKLRILRNK